MFKVFADHVASDVLEKHERDVLLIAELNELRSFFAAFAKQRPVIANKTNGIALY
jgi:hypothetical protein